jgi:hypothetical protein
MVGQGVLLKCLRDPDVELAVTVGRTATGAKLQKIVHADLARYAAIGPQLTGFDARLFCLGVSSSGMKEADYERIAYGFTLAAAETLSRLNPGMTFTYVSGAGTDSSEKGRSLWARVQGRTENALLRVPLETRMFRPGFIEAVDGIRSKTLVYRILYKVLAPLLPALRWALPQQIFEHTPDWPRNVGSTESAACEFVLCLISRAPFYPWFSRQPNR